MDMFIFASPAMLLVVIYNAKENVVIRLRHNQFSIHFTYLFIVWKCIHILCIAPDL